MTHDEQFLFATAGLMRNDPIDITRVNAMRLMAIAGMNEGATYRALRASNVPTVKLSRNTVRLLIEAGRAGLVGKSIDGPIDFSSAPEEHRDTRR